MATKPKGKVYLVGAGPGAAGLLTLRGAEVLRRADVVIYDALINRNLLHLAPDSAKLVFGGKRAREHAIPQGELNEMLARLAKEGKTVVRLKGGDPYIFGRGGEEIAHLAAARVEFEVVPGVSSFSAAAAYAGIPITHRDHSSGFVVITGYEDPDKPIPSIDWRAVANSPGTKVVFMGVKQIEQIARSLIEAGKSDTTPVAMIRWGTTGKQTTLEGTLGNIAELAEQTDFKPPAIIVIGEVVRLRNQLRWFEQKPLVGQRVVVTRSKKQLRGMSTVLTELGAEVMELPMIQIVPAEERMALLDCLMELNSYQWLVFTSANGVDMFFEQFFKAFKDLRDIGGARIAAVGPATEDRLRALHLSADVVPKQFTAAAVARAISQFESVENLKICLLRAENANPDLPSKLSEAGAIVDDIPVYQTVPETDQRAGLDELLRQTGADWITFTSGSTVRSFHERFDLPALRKQFPQMKLASIGPETTKVMDECGVKPDVEASPHTCEALVEAIKKAVRKR